MKHGAKGRPTGEAEPLTFLRVLHAVVFLLLCAAALGLGLEELKQLRFALGHPHHFGDPPSVLLTVGALLGVLCAAAILGLFVARKRIPLWLSAAALAALSCGVLGSPGRPVRRGHIAANLDILAAGRQLHRAQTDVLQTAAQISTAKEQWDAALSKLELPLSPVRGRDFSRRPFSVSLLKEADAPLDGLPAGTLAVWVSPDGAEFSIAPIGFEESGKTAPLLDELGKKVLLTAAFNPTMKQQQVETPNLDVPLPWEQPGK